MSRKNQTVYAPGKKKKATKKLDIGQKWSDTHQNANETLRTALTSSPMLGYADYTKPFTLETDASHDGLSATDSTAR